MVLYRQEELYSGERLADTLALMQGPVGRGAGPVLLEQEQCAAPEAIDPLEPLSHATAPSPLGPDSSCRSFSLAFWRTHRRWPGRELGPVGPGPIGAAGGGSGQPGVGSEQLQAAMAMTSQCLGVHLLRGWQLRAWKLYPRRPG